MTKFTPIGVLGVDETGQFRWIPINLGVTTPTTAPKTADESLGGIVKPPSPEEDRIAKEKPPAVGVDEILKKRKDEEEGQ